MPTYAYRCRACAREFELRRSMREAADPARCPDGHTDTVKLLATVALTGAGGAASSAGAAPAGGCCGGACGCGR